MTILQRCDRCKEYLCRYRVLQGIYCGPGWRVCDDCLPAHLDGAIAEAQNDLRAHHDSYLRKIVVHALVVPGIWRGGSSFKSTIRITVKPPKDAIDAHR